MRQNTDYVVVHFHTTEHLFNIHKKHISTEKIIKSESIIVKWMRDNTFRYLVTETENTVLGIAQPCMIMLKSLTWSELQSTCGYRCRCLLALRDRYHRNKRPPVDKNTFTKSLQDDLEISEALDVSSYLFGH